MPPEPKKLPGLPGLPGLPKPATQETPATQVQPLPSLPKQVTPAPSMPSMPTTPAVTPQAPAVPRFTQNPPHTQPPQVQQPQVQPASQPQQNYQEYAPQQQTAQPDFTNVQQNNEGSRKSRKAKQDVQKESKGRKTQYTGRRRNVIYARVAVFGLAGVLMVAGVFSFLPKTSGLTASDKPLIISAVRENLNYTNFPRAAGEGFSLAFATEYLNYDPETSKERYTALSAYADPDILAEIQPRVASPEELALAQETAPVATEEQDTSEVDTIVTPVASTPSNKQTVTQGPYLVGSQMYKGGTAALFTVMAEVNNKNWVYLQVPMYYSEQTGGLSISNYVTFSPTIPSTTVPQYEKSTEWEGEDREIASTIQSDMESYLKAWAAGNDTDIQRFLVKEDGDIVATKNAVEGLDGKLVYVGLEDLVVESKAALTDESTAAERESFNTRQANATVKFLEPSSGLVYIQQYRVVLEYVNQDWFVQDINNISTQLDRDEIIEKKNEEQSSSE